MHLHGVHHREVTDTLYCRIGAQTIIGLTCSGHPDRTNDFPVNQKRLTAAK